MIKTLQDYVNAFYMLCKRGFQEGQVSQNLKFHEFFARPISCRHGQWSSPIALPDLLRRQHTLRKYFEIKSLSKTKLKILKNI